MKFLDRHSLPPDAWLGLESGSNSPDSQVRIERVSKLVDRCSLVFTYHTSQALESMFNEPLKITTPSGNFFAGHEPEIKRFTACRDSAGAVVVVEFTVFHGSAIYHNETATLYVCA